MIVSSSWIYQRLICEFDHWDTCLSGLVDYNGEKWFCKIRSDDNYDLHKIEWTSECQEYLDDYRVAYAHCFHEGKPRSQYDGRPLGWFSEKWGKKDPIEDQVKDV